MKEEFIAGLRILEEHCSRGKVIVGINKESNVHDIILVVPPAERQGLLGKIQAIPPFTKTNLFNFSIKDLGYWQCRIEKYTAHISD
ncbi:hypothetical protein [Vibrio splendidus]|uniref:hypothetical protein n=1 Tax=Vibrio splendidus TaxID=29497 RepID=UPI003D0AB76B